MWPGDCSLADKETDDGANFEEQVVGGLSLLLSSHGGVLSSPVNAMRNFRETISARMHSLHGRKSIWRRRMHGGIRRQGRNLRCGSVDVLSTLPSSL